MNLKIQILSLLLFLVMGLSVVGQEVEENLRMEKPFIADGNPGEWGELSQFNSDTKLAFALANDDKRLYIIIESFDPSTSRTFLMDGITLNINVEGKKKKGVNIIFPFRKRIQMMRSQKDSTVKPLHVGNDVRPESADQLSLARGLKVIGFKNIPDTVLTENNRFGLETGLSVKQNQDLVFELSIPLSQLGIDLTYKKAIAYNIKLNKAEFEGERKKTGGTGEGGGRGGRMSGRGGGMGGAGGGRGMGSGSPRGGLGGFEKTEGAVKSDFWIKFKLAGV